MEWLRDAWAGWQSYRADVKPVALLFVALLYLVLARKSRSDAVGRTANYGVVLAVLCILPPTAAVLMCYQTRFYNYEWIWSLVPATALTALGGTIFLAEQWKPGGQASMLCRNLFLTALLATVLVLSGKPGEDEWERQMSPAARETAERVLSVAREESGGEEICLWAPREILLHARILDDQITLLYGRNMWDNALNAYSYDTYPPEMENVYLWIEGAVLNGGWVQEIRKTDPAGNGIVTETVTGTEEILYAMEAGANRIFLKDNFTEEAMEEVIAFADANDLEMRQAEGYLFLKKR